MVSLLGTKIAKENKPKVQQQGFSRGKTEAMNYTRCCTQYFFNSTYCKYTSKGIPFGSRK